ncbi:putative membrane protein [Caenispirillum salinarum AK4]|uniref:Inner membrane protein YccF n=1 Tax=Caenispirillum salinarum AK4 TaxID=1238182 RepID=K9H2V3_9PROT|nr:YccF domain-containing protein [Caenispirillum salinarum]EKV31917.1 putative membrane protein [Caenispirillum salinarum AK4]
MSLILNILWLVLGGGLVTALLWFLGAVIMAITIVGLPWARACVTIGVFNLWPFGREAIDRADVTGRDDIGTSPLGTVGNIIWFVLAGVWLAIGHVVAAVGLALTIIGIPFALQHLKLAHISLFPIGKMVVDREVAAEARRRKGSMDLDRIRTR